MIIFEGVVKKGYEVELYLGVWWDDINRLKMLGV